MWFDHEFSCFPCGIACTYLFCTRLAWEHRPVLQVGVQRLERVTDLSCRLECSASSESAVWRWKFVSASMKEASAEICSTWHKHINTWCQRSAAPNTSTRTWTRDVSDLRHSRADWTWRSQRATYIILEQVEHGRLSERLAFLELVFSWRDLFLRHCSACDEQQHTNTWRHTLSYVSIALLHH